MTEPLLAYASYTGTLRNQAALRDHGWRMLVSAAHPGLAKGFEYALDNGAWSAYTQGRPFDVPAFEKALRKFGGEADWTVLPDIVMGGERSLEVSLQWMRRVLDESPRCLLAVQDGFEPDQIREFLGARVGIFVGGSTAWKLRTLQSWGALGREVGCWVHAGRVNSRKRILLCSGFGVTSFDGTSVSRYAVTARKLDMARRQLGFLLT